MGTHLFNLIKRWKMKIRIFQNSRIYEHYIKTKSTNEMILTMDKDIEEVV